MSKKKYVNIEICQKTNVKTEIFKNSNMSKYKYVKKEMSNRNMSKQKYFKIVICQNRNMSKRNDKI